MMGAPTNLYVNYTKLKMAEPIPIKRKDNSRDQACVLSAAFPAIWGLQKCVGIRLSSALLGALTNAQPHLWEFSETGNTTRTSCISPVIGRPHVSTFRYSKLSETVHTTLTIYET
jgi:hypothetical protein